MEALCLAVSKNASRSLLAILDSTLRSVRDSMLIVDLEVISDLYILVILFINPSLINKFDNINALVHGA